MSVINQMLRDLDARRARGQLPELERTVTPASLLGTSSIPTAAVAGPSSRRWWLLASGAVAIAVLLVWHFDTARPVSVAQGGVAQAVPQVLVPAPEALVAPAPQLAASAAVPAASAPETVLRGAPATAQRPRPPARADTPAVAQAPVSAPREVTREPATVDAPAGAAAIPPPAPAAQPTERRQSAALETLAQAQALWNAGTREAGLELVREAVAAVERVQPLDVHLLVLLVREQVRMELALGRPGAALNLLNRLEPVLAGQADLLAVRGNAAQRLGRHAEAVQAYLGALQLRSGESRWMLGAAVSLAALGQLEAAAQQVEQARALGPVSPEVLGYLRQAGVPLR